MIFSIKNLLIYASLLAVMPSCSTQEQEYRSPVGYNLNKAEKYFMSESLQEISGITFVNHNADTMYAIQDEQGKLYYFPTGKKEFTHTKFGKQADYEDVSIIKNTVIVLRSNGTLITFPYAITKAPEVEDAKEWKDLLPEGEFESLYGDERDGKLYVVCKSCEEDKAGERISGVILQLNADSIVRSQDFSIDVTQIEAKGKEKKIKFKPSALTRNPRTNEWYLISSINKILVILDANWQVKDVYELNPSLFRQPEGMVFDNANNLYVSNEGDDLNNANVLKFVPTGK